MNSFYGFIILIVLFIFNRNLDYKENFEKKKIAFCFLIYDTINNENYWNLFFEKVDKSKYSIYIHYKTNKPLKYFEKYKLKNIIDTDWCGDSLVKAQNLLLEEAIKDKNNTNFIFVSNSCIPLKSFDHIYYNLNANKSYFNKGVSKYINFDSNIELYKASQWCILTKKHTLKILENKKLLSYIFDVIKKLKNICPDEYCYISILYHLNLENELIESLNIENATTFAAWYKYKNFDKSIKKGKPNNYSYICEEELNYIINSKSFFARKFDKNCKGIEKLKDIY